MTLFPLPALSDNYIWILHDGQRALVVDPGESEGVLAWLAQRSLQLDTILITHHHGDHVGGVAALRERTGARVLGPALEALPEPVERVCGGQTVAVLGIPFQVIDVPGHTAGHIAWYADAVDGAPLLFCGDTLFSAGCGRLFEGTPAQMLDSLERLAALPGATRVCCTHEYTLSNLRFALAVEPGNAALIHHADQCQALRERLEPTLPSTLATETAINPFLRSRLPAVRQAVMAHAPDTPDDAVGCFAALREWKNDFR